MLIPQGSEQALESVHNILSPTNHLADFAALGAQETLVPTFEAEHTSLCVLQHITSRTSSLASDLAHQDVDSKIDPGAVVQMSEAKPCSHLLGVSGAAFARRFVDMNALGVVMVQKGNGRGDDGFDDLHIDANRFRGNVGGGQDFQSRNELCP